ncbi:MAG: hypothetical protein FWH23_06845 [Bacteroidales bacterium]|nr:hypothetical protein [Bacteroidales bacterium]
MSILLSFLKFAVLATLGEIIALRMRTGKFIQKDFGILPRAIVWGLFGIVIALAFVLFSTGTPALLASLGWKNADIALAAVGFSWEKLCVAFCVSVAMNTIFAPVFMSFHKITDMHIARYNGSMRCFLHPIDITRSFRELNWERQWSFVFKKTIPLFWYPAHTITFMLPADWRVLFAALLSVALGILLAIEGRKAN